ncbi:MAG TPA: DUF3089 domain-containing protein [Pseudomonadales bacterium]
MNKVLGLLLWLVAAGATAVDYADPEAWLCRPEAPNACAADQTATVVTADGRLATEPFRADPNAPIDCFCVYPTVSLDETPNSDLNAGPEEFSVVVGQFARFGAVCRTYAPLYRQITLTGECVREGGFSYLSVTVHGDAADPRVDDIAGDVVVDGEIVARWSLHLVDVHLAMGNLVDLVRAQSAAFTHKLSND